MKAANAIRSHKLTNIHLTNLIDVEISEGTGVLIESNR
jgi:hypothetical protein